MSDLIENKESGFLVFCFIDELVEALKELMSRSDYCKQWVIQEERP